MKKYLLIFIVISVFITLICKFSDPRLFSHKNDFFEELTMNQGVSLEEQFTILRRHKCHGYSMLMCALEMGAPVNEIKRLISSGEDVNACEIQMFHACKPVLRYAIDRGVDPDSVEIIKILLENGASPDERTYNRVTDKQRYGFMTVFHYAVIYSSEEVVQLFLNHGADVNYTISFESDINNSRSPLESAKLLNRRDIVELLLKADALEKLTTT